MSSDESGEAAAWAAEQDMEYLDGTIFGLPSNITDHTAMIVCSGQRTVFNANLDILDALAESRHLSDDIGASVAFDRVFYVYAYAIAHAYLVSAAMARAKGFSVDVLTDVAIARSGVITSRLKEMNSAIRSCDHHVTQCSMNIWADGFRASVTTCRDLGIDDALPSAIMGHFDKAIAAGHGDKEISAIFETLVEGAGR